VKKLLFAVVIVLLAKCASTGPNYYEPWQSDYHQQFYDIRIQVVAHGLLAPSAHNTQPWIVKLDKNISDVFELYVDSERLLPETDPASRQITISQGTFLETVRIATEQLGYTMEMELFPKGEYSTSDSIQEMQDLPVARVMLLRNNPKEKPVLMQMENPQKVDLYSEIFHRVTNRTAYYGNPLTDDEMSVLLSLNNSPNLFLVFFSDAASLEKIRSLTIGGVKVEATTEQTMRETERLFRDSEKEKKKHRAGITMMSGGLKGMKLQIVQFFSNLFPISWKKMGDIWLKSETRNINSAPTFAMIISNDNSRKTQVETGMLYARFQLTASQMGISMQPLSQVLQEYPEMAELYQQVHREFAEDGQTIQILVRMGRAEDVLHSPRRDLMDILSN